MASEILMPDGMVDVRATTMKMRKRVKFNEEDLYTNTNINVNDDDVIGINQLPYSSDNISKSISNRLATNDMIGDVNRSLLIMEHGNGSKITGETGGDR